MRWGKVGWRNRAPRPSAQRGARFEVLGGGVWLGASWHTEERQRMNVGFVSENAEFPEFSWRELHVYICLLPMLPLHILWGEALMRVRVIEFQSMGLLAELELSQVPVERASLLYDGGRWMVMRVDWCVVGDQLEADLFVGRIMRDERAEVGEEVPGV